MSWTWCLSLYLDKEEFRRIAHLFSITPSDNLGISLPVDSSDGFHCVDSWVEQIEGNLSQNFGTQRHRGGFRFSSCVGARVS